MRWWKQAALATALAAVVIALWVLYLPSAGAVLARLGIGTPAAENAATAGGGGQGGGPGGGFGGAPEVIVATVTEGNDGGRLTAIGDGRAARSVAVTPLASGRIEEIAVRSGERVEAGGLLAILDSDAEEIGVDRAELALRDAEATLERIERLRATGSSTDVQLREARLALDRARLELRDAELALERRAVRAPIAGIVGIIPVDPGTQVSTTSEVMIIDDRSRILVEFRVPERWVGRIAEGDRIEATALARPGVALEGEVLALDNRIEQTTRTLRIQAAIDNPDDTLRAGMAFRIALAFEGDTYPAVDPLAIQWSSDGPYVWIVRNDRLARVPIRLVQRGTDRVLVTGDLEAGEAIVVEGVQRLREGIEVRARPLPGLEGEGAGLDLSRATPALSDT